MAGCLPGTTGTELERCLRAQKASGAHRIIKALPDGPGTLLNPATDGAHSDLAALLADTKKLKYVNPGATLHGVNEAAIEQRLIRDIIARSSSIPSLGRTSLSHGAFKIYCTACKDGAINCLYCCYCGGVCVNIDQWHQLHLARALSAPHRPALLLSLPTRCFTEQGEGCLFQHLRDDIEAQQVVAVSSTRAWTVQLADHAVLISSEGRLIEERSVAEVKEISAELGRQLAAAALQAQAQVLSAYGNEEDSEARQYLHSLLTASRTQLMESFKERSPLAVQLYRSLHPED